MFRECLAVPGFETSKGGRGRGANKLQPNNEAVGAHTTFQRGTNGKIHKYETYEKTSSWHFNPTKRYDGGKPDGSPGAPHIKKQVNLYLHRTLKERMSQAGLEQQNLTKFQDKKQSVKYGSN
ncbi:polymorphic toxin type 24 domain-containing protein [Chryseobacterium luteum]|uniref:polymorphic toxin type 24 domain-containing protein n=1 Tax=Chryseobacterium luteum TaxID=421531 RepID=UPI00373FC843